MNITHPPVVNHDDRGMIIDVLKGQTDAATLISLEQYAERGRHYHKDTTQWVYILRGTVMTTTTKYAIKSGIARVVLVQGDMIRHDPGEMHTMRGLEYSVILVLTQGPRSGEDYESDTYRL